MSRIPVVNEADEIIGYKERDEVTDADIDRVAALWITNAAGQVLMAQRSAAKKRDPNLWGPAVAGTVEEGETYEDNIIKEAFEEIGVVVTPEDLRPGPKMRVMHGGRNYFCQWFLYTLDKAETEFILQAEEVSRVAWFDPTELKAGIASHPERFVPSAEVWSETLL